MSKARNTSSDQRLKQSRFVRAGERLIVEQPPLLALLHCLMESASPSMVEGSDELALSVQQQRLVESSADRLVPPSSPPPDTPAAEHADPSNSRIGPRVNLQQTRVLKRFSQENPPLAAHGQRWMRYGMVHFSTSANVQSFQLSFDFRELVTQLNRLVVHTLGSSARFQWGTLDTDDQGTQIKAIFYDPMTSHTLETGYCGVAATNRLAQQRPRKAIGLFVTHPLLNSLIAKQIEHAGFQLAGAHEAARVRIQDTTAHPLMSRAWESPQRSQVLSLPAPHRGGNIDGHLTYAFSQVQNFLDHLNHLEPGVHHAHKKCLFFGPRDPHAMRLTHSLRKMGIGVRQAQDEDDQPTLSSQDIVLINALDANPAEWPSALEMLILQHSKVWIIRPALTSARAALDALATQRRETLPELTFIEHHVGAYPRLIEQLAETARESNTLAAPRVPSSLHQMGALERGVLARYIGRLSMALAASDSSHIESLLHQMAGWLGLADDNTLPLGFREDIVSLYRRSDRSNLELMRLILVGATWVTQSTSMSAPAQQE